MLTNIDGVIFDLDGTLVDSMWIWEDIDIDYLKKYNIELPNDLQGDIEGKSFSETIAYFQERFDIKDSSEKIKEDWLAMARHKYENEIPLKEGAREFLELLKLKGIKMGIATSNTRELAETIIDKHGIRDFFDSIRTSCEAKRGKPHPDVYLLVAGELGIKPENIIVFEDVLQGIRGAKKANMKVCAIYDEYSKDITEEKKKEADYYIDSYLELVGL